MLGEARKDRHGGPTRLPLQGQTRSGGMTELGGNEQGGNSGQLQGTYETMEPALLFSIRPASWKQKSSQGCLEKANGGK